MNQDVNVVANEIAKLCPFPPTPRSLASPGGLSPPPGLPLSAKIACLQTSCAGLSEATVTAIRVKSDEKNVTPLSNRWPLRADTGPDATHAGDARFDRLLGRLPSPLRIMVRRVRQPSAIWIRWPAGILLICGGLLSFLPILGLWMLPLGLMLLADDIPALRSLRSHILDWIERRHPHWLTG
jgi:hypothetical protein